MEHAHTEVQSAGLMLLQPCLAFWQRTGYTGKAKRQNMGECPSRDKE